MRKPEEECCKTSWRAFKNDLNSTLYPLKCKVPTLEPICREPQIELCENERLACLDIYRMHYKRLAFTRHYFVDAGLADVSVYVLVKIVSCISSIQRTENCPPTLCSCRSHHIVNRKGSCLGTQSPPIQHITTQLKKSSSSRSLSSSLSKLE